MSAEPTTPLGGGLVPAAPLPPVGACSMEEAYANLSWAASAPATAFPTDPPADVPATVPVKSPEDR